MVLIRYLVLLGLLLFPGHLSFAADPPATSPAEVQVETAPVLSDLGPKRAEFAIFVEQSLSELSQLAELKKAREKYALITSLLEEAQQQLTGMGDPTTWYVDRLSQTNSQFRQFRKDFDALQNGLTERQKTIEEIQSRLEKEKDFWSKWTATIKEQKLKVPDKSVDQVNKDLAQVEDVLKKSATTIIALQEKIGGRQQDVAAELERFEKALAQLRKETFRKNAYSFFTPRYYNQLNNELWEQVNTGLASTMSFDLNYFQRFGWLLGLMLFSFTVLAGLIIRFRSYLAEAEGWQFVLSHPLATSCFTVIVGFSPFLTAPPELLHFTLLCGGVIAVTTLAAPLTENRRQARILALAALLLILTTGFRLIALPQPLYRLYLTLLSLGMIPLLLWQAKASLLRRGPLAGRFYRQVLKVATLVLILSLIAQLSGYMNFSFWLLQATFETGLVILFAHMALRLGRGGIQFLLKNKQLGTKTFFKKYARECAARLEKLLQLLIIMYGVFYLLPEWRIFASATEAWAFFAEVSVSFGTQKITLGMVILSAASLYLAMQISWLLQAMSETQVFYRKSVDRGVRDAIKKLIHYAMVLVGLLFALSILGMRLQNFVVILGALGVGIGFGLQDIVNNFLSGLILLFERPVKVGDGVLIDGEYGTVAKIGLRSTVVETLDHAELIVPNAQIISQKVTNWTHSTRRVRLVIPVGVAYGSNIEKVITILGDAGKNNPDVLKDPAPSPIFVAFGESSLDFELRVWIPNIDARPRIKSELLVEIDQQFRKANVEIPFPQRDLHLRSVDGSILEKTHPLRTTPPEEN